jgi:hypothetical protein
MTSVTVPELSLIGKAKLRMGTGEILPMVYSPDEIFSDAIAFLKYLRSVYEIGPFDGIAEAQREPFLSMIMILVI